MGLDMYLNAKLYIPAYDHNTEKEKKLYKEIADKCDIIKHAYRNDTRSVEVSFIVAYWRKANHIHKWFVKNVQDEIDECQDSYISREQLQELVDTCKKILNTIETVKGDVHTGTVYYPDGTVQNLTKKGRLVAQKNIAEKFLPTQEGFFFGSTDYDEYYLQDLQSTIDMIEPLLNDKNLDKFDFYYRSSW